jgi:DNA-binding CsgD family transcriptional regulator
MKRLCCVCGGEVAHDGRTALKAAKAHDEWRIGPHGPYETSTPCGGSGRPTEAPPVEPAPAGPIPTGLTTAQARVAWPLRGTLTMAEIGVQLGLSVHTVKSHASVVYQVAGVRGRAGMRTWTPRGDTACDR